MQRKKLEGISGALPRPSAEAILGDVATGLIATGTTQADAFALTASVNVFGTVAAGSGARADAYQDLSDETLVANLGANALLVYPPVGGVINTLATNAAISVPAGKTLTLKKVSATLLVGAVSA